MPTTLARWLTVPDRIDLPRRYLARLATSAGLVTLGLVGLGGTVPPGSLTPVGPTPVAAQEPEPNSAVETPAAGDGERGWLGIAFRERRRGRVGPGAPGAETTGDGVVISGVLRGSPADRAGIRPGEVLVRFEGRAVGPDGLASLAREIRAGDSVSLTLRGPEGVREVVLEAGRRPERIPPSLDPEILARVDSIQEAVRRRLEILRQEMRRDGVDPLPRFRLPEPFDSGPRPDLDDLGPRDSGDVPGIRRPPRPYAMGADFVAGARMATVNEGLAEYFDVDGGVLVVDVLDGSPADEVGLRPGDVITGLDGMDLGTLQELRSTLLRRDGSRAELRVVRRGEELEIQLP